MRHVAWIQHWSVLDHIQNLAELTEAGNFSREEGAQFLKGFSEVLQSSDSMLVGLDATSDPSKV